MSWCQQTVLLLLLPLSSAGADGPTDWAMALGNALPELVGDEYSWDLSTRASQFTVRDKKWKGEELYIRVRVLVIVRMTHRVCAHHFDLACSVFLRTGHTWNAVQQCSHAPSYRIICLKKRRVGCNFTAN